MNRRRVPFRAIVALAAAIGVCASSVPGRAAPTRAAPSRAAPRRAQGPAPLPPLAERVRQDSLQFAAALQGQRFGDLHPRLERDLKDARRAGNHAALRTLLRLQGVAYAMSGDAAHATPALDEGLALSEASGDTLQILTVLRWRAYVAGMVGHMDEQRDLAERLVRVAETYGDLRFMAIGHNFLGWNARGRGNLVKARFHLERAVSGQRTLHNELDEAIALTAYGATLNDLDDAAEARRSYQRQLDIARRLHQPWLEAQALNDLGVLERREGDPGRGAEDIRAAYEIRRAQGETPDLAAVLLNLASVETEIGRIEAASQLAREGLALCERRGFVRLRATFHSSLAIIAEHEMHPDEAAAHWKRIIAMGDSAEPRTRALAVMGMARAAQDAGRPAEDLALFENAARDLGSRLPRREAQQLQSGLSTRLYDAGRVSDALAAAGKAIALGSGSSGSPWNARAWWMAAVSQRRLGHPEAANAAFDSACTSWERYRARPSDPEWRELLGDSDDLMADVADFLLSWPPSASDSARLETAYAKVQRFRARTLLERLEGSRAGADAAGGARGAGLVGRIQRELLGPGELLLEWVTGREKTLLFAITAKERHVFKLPGRESLGARIRTARELLASAPSSPSDRAATVAVGRELARLVLGDALPLVVKSRGLVLVPDGPLNLVPFGALVTGSEPLVGAHGVTLAPSVAVLEQARRRTVNTRPGRVLLAVGSSAGGVRLAGAEHEIAWLAGAFEGVKRASAGAAKDESALDEYDALHFAGHTSTDDDFPWRSGIEVGAGWAAAASPGVRGAPEPSAAGEMLRARTIATLPLRARLVVLSSCETAAGRIINGEGVSGLSTAFLAAGARTVVATLWRVDDRATEKLMREFYRGLASRHTAAEALRAAQDHLRRTRETSHPYYWAGFVLLGDGATTLPLKSASLWRRGANFGRL